MKLILQLDTSYHTRPPLFVKLLELRLLDGLQSQRYPAVQARTSLIPLYQRSCLPVKENLLDGYAHRMVWD
jgi:hypothetical protein